MALASAPTVGQLTLRDLNVSSLSSPSGCPSSVLSVKTARGCLAKQNLALVFGRSFQSKPVERIRYRVRANEQAVSNEEVAASEEEISDAQSDVESDAESDFEPSTPSLLDKIKELVDENHESWPSIAAEISALIKSSEELSQKVGALTEEANLGKDRLLRLNADFDNFRKRSEREKIAMASTVRGEVVEDLLPMVDNFERAKSALVLQTEAEKKVDSSYQGIYKQFVEIMKNLGVTAVETVGLEFDPEVHEAIMREDSTEFPEDVIIQEFRKGFMIGDKLLRPAMVKVSSGPGPEPPQDSLSELEPESESASNAEGQSTTGPEENSE